MSGRVTTPSSPAASPVPNDKSVLLTFLNISYLTGVSPFKLKTLKDGSVRLQTNYFHKVLFSCLVVCTNFVRFAEVRMRLPQSHEDWNPLFYFQFLSGSINVVFNITVGLALLFKAESMASLVNFLNKSSHLPRPKFAETFKFAIRWICIVEIILGIGIALADMRLFSFSPSSLHWNMTTTMWCMKHEARFTAFLDSAYKCGNGSYFRPIYDSGEELHLTASEYGIAFAFGILKIFRQICGYLGELLLLVGATELWLPAFSFNRIVKSDLYNSRADGEGVSIIPFIAKFEILQQHYNALKGFSKMINDIFSRPLLWFIIASVFYYSCNLDALFMTKNHFERIRTISFYVSALATVLLAADISHKVKAIDEWLSELSTKEIGMIPQNSLMVILHELDSNKVGITGSNIFTVTYSFIANVNRTSRISSFIVCCCFNELAMTGVLIVCVQARSPWIYSYDGFIGTG